MVDRRATRKKMAIEVDVTMARGDVVAKVSAEALKRVLKRVGVNRDLLAEVQVLQH